MKLGLHIIEGISTVAEILVWVSNFSMQEGVKIRVGKVFDLMAIGGIKSFKLSLSRQDLPMVSDSFVLFCDLFNAGIERVL